MSVCSSLCGDRKWKFTIVMGTNSPGPHKFEGILETINVVLVSGLQVNVRVRVRG